MYSDGSQLSMYTNNYFYWHLVLAVLKNNGANRFTTAPIELLCTSVLISF
jgi:hypothetical protein